MGLTLKKLLEIKAKKDKYYQDLVDNNETPRYGMGGKYRRMNTEAARGKRRRGFKRYSVRQRGGVTEAYIQRRKEWANRKSLCTILKPRIINQLYEGKDMISIMSYIYESYHKIQLLDPEDLYLKRLSILVGASKNKERKEFLENEYTELFHSAIIKFMETINNYKQANNRSFYSYVINVLPFLFTTLFNKAWNVNSRAYESVDDLVGLEDVNLYENLLWIHVLTNNMTKKDKRELLWKMI